MKLIGKMLILVLVVLVVLVLARNVIVKSVVEKGVTMVTGLPLTIKKFDLGLTKTYVSIEELVVKNPDGFHDTVFVEIPKILVDYNLSDILKGKLHLEDLVFDMKQFSVVRNEKGALNLDSLKALQKAQQPSQPAPSQGKQEKGQPMAIQIDNFHLKVGKASFVNYSSGQPSVQDFNVGLDEHYQNITDPNKLVALIVVKVMMRTPLAMLSGFNLGGLQTSIAGIAGSAAEVAGKFAAQGIDTLKDATGVTTQVAGKAEDTLKSTAGTVKDVASSLKSKLKLPFGSKTEG